MAEPTVDNNLEELRWRQELACAECRRLRIRCDRQIPCAACIRRGCSNICPIGVLPVATHRMKLATFTQLHEKIRIMKKRVRDLETALQTAQSRVSGEVHSLLIQTNQQADETVEATQEEQPSGSIGGGDIIPFFASIASGETTLEETTSTEDALARAFGTLSITPERGQKWYGNIAASEHFLEGEGHPRGVKTLTESELPAEVLYLSTCFPFAIFYGLADSVSEQLERWLPPRTTAWQLVENYFRRMSALQNIVPRDRFLKEIWRPLYESSGPVSVEQLALMFIVLACGALADFNLESENSNMDKFYQLARCAMVVKPSLNLPSITDVQTQLLMTFYLQLSFRREEAWLSIAIGGKMAQYIGLHRDPALLPGFSQEDIEFRRWLFWELMDGLWVLDFIFDSPFNLTIKSLGLGRPPSILDAYTDCQCPRYAEEVDTRVETFDPYHRFRHELRRKYLVTLIQEPSYTTHPSAYESVLALDKGIRNNVFSPHLCIGASPASGFGPSEEGLTLQRYTAFLAQQFVLLLIHRSYSCQAASEMPLNPVKHRFGPSVLATYKAAITVADTVTDLVAHHPLWTLRLVPVYSVAFCAAVTLGSLVIFAPRWTHAVKVLMHLDNICKVFETAEVIQLRKLLPHLQKLREEAREAYRRPNVASNDQALGLELAIRLSGDKPILDTTKKTRVSLADSPAFREVHPAIISYLEELDQSSGAVTPVWSDPERPGLAEFALPNRDPRHVAVAPPGDASEESWQMYLTRLGLSMGGHPGKRDYQPAPSADR